MKRNDAQKPGEVAKRSAQWERLGPRGGHTGVEVTVPKGHRLPPGTQRGETFIPVDPTKNKSGRG